ncbi:acyl-CoA thioester hydrolase [Propionicimonas paludicola]|uniref:Acyl-CoA thioester hydrolase n=1 Tax=Propionicimonas paludicola TaxID=185243 RepID=A0A2A9CNX1_9ACTN|nr:thioesterase family protein [Propionicimonas paludicola]PFG16038.1 acyl-CoA thioester hydrolase [Propionicimonas paludicola]
MSFDSSVPLRWVDVDAQGHVNNALIADYLQEARVDWLQSGANAHLLGDATMVVSHQVEYLGPVFFSTTPLRVSLDVGVVGAARFVLGYQVFQDERLVSRARSTLCLYDYRAARIRRMTGAEREWFAAQSVALEPFRAIDGWRVGPDASEHTFTVRWSDQDAYRHVNNVRVFDYFAEARVRLTPEPGPDRMTQAAAEQLTWMVARQDVDYLGQIVQRPEPYRVRTAVAKLGRTSATLVAEVQDPLDDRVLARAHTVLVSGDVSGRPVPLPKVMHDSAAAWPAVRAVRA